MVQPTPRCFGMPYHLVSRIPGLQVQQLCQITTPATAVATADKGTSRKWFFIHISQSLSVKCQSNFPNLHIKQRNVWMKQAGESVCAFDGVKAHTQPPRCHISKSDSLELLVFVFFSQWGHKASAQWGSDRARVQQSVKSTYYCILTPCCDCLEVKPSEGL